VTRIPGQDAVVAAASGRAYPVFVAPASCRLFWFSRSIENRRHGAGATKSTVSQTGRSWLTTRETLPLKFGPLDKLDTNRAVALETLLECAACAS
jgi:hypothetical protein